MPSTDLNGTKDNFTCHLTDQTHVVWISKWKILLFFELLRWYNQESSTCIITQNSKTDVFESWLRTCRTSFIAILLAYEYVCISQRYSRLILCIRLSEIAEPCDSLFSKILDRKCTFPLRKKYRDDSFFAFTCNRYYILVRIQRIVLCDLSCFSIPDFSHVAIAQR